MSFRTGIGLLANNEVVARVDVGLMAKFLSGLLQESKNSLVAEELTLLVGSTGDLGDSEEVLPAVLVSREFIHQILKIPIEIREMMNDIEILGGFGFLLVNATYLGNTIGIVS